MCGHRGHRAPCVVGRLRGAGGGGLLLSCRIVHRPAVWGNTSEFRDLGDVLVCRELPPLTCCCYVCTQQALAVWRTRTHTHMDMEPPRWSPVHSHTQGCAVRLVMACCMLLPSAHHPRLCVWQVRRPPLPTRSLPDGLIANLPHGLKRSPIASFGPAALHADRDHRRSQGSPPCNPAPCRCAWHVMWHMVGLNKAKAHSLGVLGARCHARDFKPEPGHGGCCWLTTRQDRETRCVPTETVRRWLLRQGQE